MIRDLRTLIARERFSYLCAFLSSLAISFYLLVQIFQYDILASVMKMKLLAITLLLLGIGNVIHGYFAFRSFFQLADLKINEVINVKKMFYISLFFNFIIPYNVLIYTFYHLNQGQVALSALILLFAIVLTCLYCDILPFIKSVKNILKMSQQAS